MVLFIANLKAKGYLGFQENLQSSLSIKEITFMLRKRAKEEGMMTMLEDGIFLAVQGRTSTEEVLRVVSE